MTPAALAAAAGAAVAAISELAGGAEAIILWGTAAAILTELWRRFLLPASRLLHRVIQAVDLLELLPLVHQVVEDHDERLRELEDRAAGGRTRARPMVDPIRPG